MNLIRCSFNITLHTFGIVLRCTTPASVLFYYSYRYILQILWFIPLLKLISSKISSFLFNYTFFIHIVYLTDSTFPLSASLSLFFKLAFPYHEYRTLSLLVPSRYAWCLWEVRLASFLEPWQISAGRNGRESKSSGNASNPLRCVRKPLSRVLIEYFHIYMFYYARGFITMYIFFAVSPEDVTNACNVHNINSKKLLDDSYFMLRLDAQHRWRFLELLKTEKAWTGL